MVNIIGKKVKMIKNDKGEKDKKGRDSSSDNESDDDVIEESLYDKLLSLVSIDKKVKYDKTMKRGPNIRLFDGSVMGGKSRVWNLNYAPMSNGSKSFEGSTNIFKSKSILSTPFLYFLKLLIYG